MSRNAWPLLLIGMGCDDTIFGSSHEVTGSGFDAVVEIFDAECTSCHNPGTAANFGNLDLETDPCGAMVGVSAANPSFGGDLLVAPGDYEASVLWDKVSGNGVYGGVMPTAGTMDDTNIDIIEDWIDQGAECGEGDGGDGGGGDDTGDTGEAGTEAEPVPSNDRSDATRGGRPSDTEPVVMTHARILGGAAQ